MCGEQKALLTVFLGGESLDGRKTGKGMSSRNQKSIPQRLLVQTRNLPPTNLHNLTLGSLLVLETSLRPASPGTGETESFPLMFRITPRFAKMGYWATVVSKANIINYPVPMPTPPSLPQSASSSVVLVCISLQITFLCTCRHRPLLFSRLQKLLVLLHSTPFQKPSMFPTED